MTTIQALVLHQVIYTCVVILSAFVLMEIVRNRWIRVAAVVAVFLFMGHIFSLGLVDDTYISLRFARNYAEGHGLVFNVGERVEGYTCFLWVWLLGTIKRLFVQVDLVHLARALGIAFSVLALLVIHRFSMYLSGGGSRRHAFSGAAGAFPLMLVGANFAFVFWGFSGMETGLYVLCLAGSSYFFARYLLEAKGDLRNLFWSSLILVFAMMTRPEAYLLAVCNLGFVLLARKQNRPRHVGMFLLPFLALFLPYFIWRFRYYGYPFPNTYYAKVAGGSVSLARLGLSYLAQGAVAHAVFIVLILTKAARRHRSFGIVDYYLLTLILVWTGTVIYTGADHFREYRFFVYVLPFMYVFVFDEIGILFGKMGERASRLFRVRWGIAFEHFLAVLAALLTLLVMFFYQNEGPRLVLMGGRPHAEKWALLGKWLDENADPGDVVATPVVGAIGYYCHATIVDMLGIVDETIAHTPVADPGAGPKDHNRFNTEYVLGRKPDYIYLLHSRPTEEVFLEKPSWLPALEDLKRYFPREDYEFKAITIDHCRFCLYVRRD